MWYLRGVVTAFFHRATDKRLVFNTARSLKSVFLDHLSVVCWLLGPHETLPYVTGSVKIRHNRAFSISCILNIYNLLSQVYPLAKFQPHTPITLGVTALQSSNNRKINLYSKYRENKLQAPTKRIVTYQRIEVRSYNFHLHMITST